MRQCNVFVTIAAAELPHGVTGKESAQHLEYLRYYVRNVHMTAYFILFIFLFISLFIIYLV